MPLRVRCPHCQASLTAADDQAGLAAFCSECGGSFRMPMPESVQAVEAISITSDCPRCRAEIAPGTHVCPRCAFDLNLRRRQPLSQRMMRWGLKGWVIAAASFAVIAISVWIGLEVYRIQRPANPPVTVVEVPATQPQLHDLMPAVQRLFAASNSVDRKRALTALNSFGSEAVTPLLEIIRTGKTGRGAKQQTLNTRAALAFVAQHGSTVALDSLRKLQQQPALRINALNARGLLNDASATNEIVSSWCDLTRRRLFFEQLSKVAPPLVEGADRAMVSSAQQSADQLAESLRVLGAANESTVVPQLLDRYFLSWQWLGQDRAERFAAEVWDAAKPPRDSDHDFKHRVRSARRVLDRTARNVSPAACAAAALVLVQCGPQYESLRKEIAASLSAKLDSCSATDQQQVVWALASLENRRFGEFSAQSAPQDATSEIIRAVSNSASSSPRPANGSKAQTAPAPPLPVFRVVTAKRQLEESLLPQMAKNWEAAERATDCWIASDVGLTPRLARRLDPAEKNPNPVSLGCAIAIAARTNDALARKNLSVWANAADQPAWVRASAVTAMAAMDSRAGRDISDWPQKIDVSVFGTSDVGNDAPSVAYWGLLIDAGGMPLKAQLRATGSAIPVRVRDTLLRAAESSAARTRRGI